jgi:hypothetical protein
MAQIFQRVGCTDPQASNYDSTATVLCSDCCKYGVSNIIGCMDKLAINYNQSANVPCENCCTYKEYKPARTPILYEKERFESFSLYDASPQIPYHINPNDGLYMCIKDSGYEERGWIVDGRYSDGYFTYIESLYSQWRSTLIPNAFTTLTSIRKAFDVLLLNKPDSRIFFNVRDLVPWMVPLYVSQDGGRILKNTTNELRLKTDCDSVNGSLYYYQDEEVAPSSQFVACLCDNNKQTCTTDILNFKGEPRVKNQLITPYTVTCIGEPIQSMAYQNYYVFLQNQYTWMGWDGRETSFFNKVLFKSMGISDGDARFIVKNITNNGPANYPYGDITTVPNGRSLCLDILKNAFDNGANFWLPNSHEVSTDIINTRECCDLTDGGVYFEDTNSEEIYAVAYGGKEYEVVSPTGRFREVTRGVCLCESSKCPTLSSGEVEIITQVIETREGIQQISYVDVPENCCSNESLQSKMKGEWIWDGKRCVLQQNDNNNTCDDVGSTVITINETPISIKDVNCEGDVVTVSAYIYFSAPDNRCTNGVLVSDTSDKLTDEFLGLLKSNPETTSEIATFEKAYRYGKSDPVDEPPTPQPRTSNCCYDTEVPILGQLVIQDGNYKIIDSTAIEYVDTFSSTQTNINTNANVGQGFNIWIKLTTVIDLTQFNLDTFNIAVEFTQGLYKCCDYDIYFDDIEVGCLQPGIRETIVVEPCVGFDLSSCVIDNKKSWVYNPGKAEMSDSVYDNIVRGNGSLGMNIEQTGVIRAGGHGAINRVFAPSVDAELDFRDTDYFNFHGVIEKHSKLVLNSKQLILQFNMCPDSDCVLGSYGYLTDDDGSYILDDDGGRIIVQDEIVPFPNLVQLETFKKTFQSFWMQIIEQFIPATTIFVGGEKWCNNRICEQKVVADYLLDARSDELSPAPVSDNIIEDPTTQDDNSKSQNSPIVKTTSNTPNETPVNGEKGTTSDTVGPMIVGNYKIYGTHNLDPEFGTVVYRKRGSAV